MRRYWPFIGCVVCLGSGCVIVNPGRVEVSASPKPLVIGSREEPPPATAYGPALERVCRQQVKVIDELQQRDWKDVLDETADWTEQIRTLAGYANATHDPALFKAYCERLLAHTHAIREAALRQDPVACNAAIHACDPVLDCLRRDFPTRITPAATPPPSGSAARPNSMQVP